MQVRVVNIIFNNAILLFILDEPLNFFSEENSEAPRPAIKGQKYDLFYGGWAGPC